VREGQRIDEGCERSAAVPSEFAGPYPNMYTIRFTCFLPRLATSGFTASLASNQFDPPVPASSEAR